MFYPNKTNLKTLCVKGANYPTTIVNIRQNLCQPQ